MEFLVIAHDRTDDEALARRMVVRERHLAAAHRTIETGNMLIGGAILDGEGRMVGSMTVVSFSDQGAFDEWLENVPYNKNGIWEKVEVYPYHVAVTASPPDDGGVRADRRHDQTMRKGRRMPLDPKVRELLDLSADAPPLGTVPVEIMRESVPSQMAAWFRMGLVSTPVAAVEDRVIPGPDGDLPVRVYTPEGRGTSPIIVFFHGGGWVLGDLDTHDAICRSLCAGAECVVVSVGYRRAPEHRFPAATDDALAAARWVAEHAGEVGGDATRIAVAGDSAGGNLATVTALRIRDEDGPALRGQLLIYPVVGYHTPPTPSYLENAEGYGMTREAMVWFWEQYLADAAQATHPHAMPLVAPDLRGLPPALVITAEYDVLRDEGERYVGRLRAAGVPARLSRYDGVHHRFAEMIGILDQAEKARDEMCAWLREVFAEPGPSTALPDEGAARQPEGDGPTRGGTVREEVGM